MLRHVACFSATAAVVAQARQITKRGNRTDDQNTIAHPFIKLKGSEHEVDVDAIHYPDIGAFSVKLTKTRES